MKMTHNNWNELKLTKLTWIYISDMIYDLQYEPLMNNGFGDMLMETIETEFVDDFIEILNDETEFDSDMPIFYDENLYNIVSYDEIDQYIVLTDLKQHIKIMYQMMVEQI